MPTTRPTTMASARTVRVGPGGGATKTTRAEVAEASSTTQAGTKNVGTSNRRILLLLSLKNRGGRRGVSPAVFVSSTGTGPVARQATAETSPASRRAWKSFLDAL